MWAKACCHASHCTAATAASSKTATQHTCCLTHTLHLSPDACCSQQECPGPQGLAVRRWWRHHLARTPHARCGTRTGLQWQGSSCPRVDHWVPELKQPKTLEPVTCPCRQLVGVACLSNSPALLCFAGPVCQVLTTLKPTASGSMAMGAPTGAAAMATMVAGTGMAASLQVCGWHNATPALFASLLAAVSNMNPVQDVICKGVAQLSRVLQEYAAGL